MNVLQALGNFFKKFFKQAVQEQIDIILPVARQAVQMVAKDPSIATSDAKRAAAIAFIMSELTAKEVVFAKRMVNLVLEIAVVEIKGIE